MKNLLLSPLLGALLIFVALCPLPSSAADVEPDSLTIGFVTCYPGPEIFELYGHEAVRVSGRLNGHPLDVVFNYGLFDFNSPGFVYRFVKGETDYNIGVQPTELFLIPYSERGSKVVERVLPLSQVEAHRMLDSLRADVKPGADTYRYKYFTANCATKPLDHLDNITDGRFGAKQEKAQKATTYRELLRKYNEGYPWYQLGIDLVLGYKLDEPVTSRQATFVPVELDTRYFGGLPMRVLEQGQADGNRRGAPTPWFLTPLFAGWTIFVIVLSFIITRWYRGDSAWSLRSRMLYSSWYTLAGLAGCLIWFLTFFSAHEGTSPNLNAIWLNPIWLLPAGMVWIPSCRKIVKWLIGAEGSLTLVLLLVWPILPQSMNSAMVPLMLTSIVLSLRPLCRAAQRPIVSASSRG